MSVVNGDGLLTKADTVTPDEWKQLFLNKKLSYDFSLKLRKSDLIHLHHSQHQYSPGISKSI